MSGLITTNYYSHLMQLSIARVHGAVFTHHKCVTITAVLELVILVNLTSVLGKGCLHTAIYTEYDTLFPSRLYTLADVDDPIGLDMNQ